METGFCSMSGLRQEIAAFIENKQSWASEARQMAALQIACHFDLAEALNAEPGVRARIVLRLERMIERERQRGARKHWSYDLNRHIALKQALDRLRPEEPGVGRSVCSVERAERSIKRKRRPRTPHQFISESLPQL
jgi:hypothetical protein